MELRLKIAVPIRLSGGTPVDLTELCRRRLLTCEYHHGNEDVLEYGM